MTDQLETDEGADHVAIIGMAGRFPGAGDPEAFWHNIAGGVESITWLSEEDLRAAGVPEASIRDPHQVPAATLLEGLDRFDAAFFRFTPLEAGVLDPQHRLLLECSQSLFDHAGHDPARLGGRTGVYVGVGFPSYLVHNLLRRPDVIEDVGMQRIFFATDKGFAPTRISHKFDLTGPSVGIDTACSSSLVAVHQACRALIGYDCDLALAGGASAVLPERAGYRYEEGGITSPDGHCRPFDAAARGTRFGSGVGLVLLKRLDEAILDRDNILAVIRGSAVNNDGSAKAGFTAPSASGQAAVVAEALALAGTPADTIGYVEAHGTGTRIGDPIEVAGLTRAYREQTRRRQFCAIGSVKSNVGHLDVAAGVTGLIKAVQALRHAELPPTVNFEQPNPAIDFAAGPFYVNAQLRPWPAADGPRRAAVSSFGIGGTNAHVIVEEAPEADRSGPSRAEQLLVLSARTGPALRRMSDDLAAALSTAGPADLPDVAFTLSRGRRAHAHRFTVVCRDPQEAIAALQAAPGVSGGAFSEAGDAASKVVFLFPGQGAQQPQMLADSYRQEAVFRREVDRCAEHAMAGLGRDLRPVIYGDGDPASLDETRLTQPALFTVSLALARLWQSWGIEPVTVLGHSLGEFVAATVAGVFTTETALDLVIERARLMSAAPPGAMLAVSLDETALGAHLGECAPAAFNDPLQSVAGGSVAAIEALERRLTAAGVEHRRLRASHAFHTSALDDAAREFQAEVARVRPKAPEIPIVSCRTGRVLTAADLQDPAYWARQMREPVRFADAVATLRRDPAHLYLEVGPGRTLAPMLRRAGVTVDRIVVSAPEAESDSRALLTALGALFARGVEVNWDGYWSGERRHRVPLPGYPFERQRHWIDPSPPSADDSAASPFRVRRWQPDRLPEPAPGPPAGSWLLLTDDLTSEDFARGLTGPAEPLIRRAAPGDDPRAIGRLLSELDAEGRFPALVVLPHTLGSQPVAIDDGVSVVVAWSAALAGYAAGRPVSLAVVTDRALAVTPEEVPARSALAGACRALARAHRDVAVACFDLDGPTESGARAVVAEFAAGFTAPAVALRNEVRQVEVHDQPPAGGTALPAERPSCVITDGQAPAAQALALRLAAQRQARITLLGRWDLPPREDWPAWLDEVEGPRRAKAAVGRGEQVGRVEGWKDGPVPGESPRDPAAEALLNRLCGSYAYQTLTAAGVSLERGRTYRPAEIAELMRLLPAYRKFLDFFLRVLHEDGVVRLVGDQVEVLLEPDLVDPAGVRSQLPGFAPVIDFLEHCVARFPQALAGDVDAVGVLFPDGSPQRLEEAFRVLLDHSDYAARARRLGQALAGLARATPGRPLRVLEVGGGNGLLLTELAAALRDTEVEYWFTDIGQSFVRAAETSPAGYGFARWRCGVLDVAKDPEQQGLPLYHFDAVVGFDVVHATARIADTVENLRSLLAPGGYLCLIEATVSLRWVDMFWGLAEGWWAFEDTEIRAASPLMPLHTWESVLRGLRFSQVDVYPPGDPDYALILARQPEEPDDARFEAHLAARADQLLSGRRAHLAAIEALQQQGAQVRVESADLTSPAEIGAALARVGTVDAWIHVPESTAAAGLRWQISREAATVRALRAVAGARLTVVTGAGTDPVAARAVEAVVDTLAATIHAAGDLDGVELGLGRRGVLVRPERERTEAPERATAETPVGDRDVEAELLGVFRQLFGSEEIGLDDDFYQLGGDSLLASQIIARVRRQFAADLPVRALFDAPTVVGLAAAVRAVRAVDAHPDVPLMRVDRHDLMPLSFGQQSLWLAEQVNGRSTRYHLAGAVRLTGALDVGTLRRSLAEVIRRHEVLRTTFHTVDGVPMQRVRGDVTVELPVRAAREEEIEDLAQAHAHGLFDLETGPLMRVAMLEISERDHVLLVNIHHIVADGWSLGVLVTELITLYSAFVEDNPSPLTELEYQYVDFAQWQRAWLDGRPFEEQLAYWRQRLNGAPPRLELPADRSRPARPRIRNAVRRFVVPPDLAARLTDLARAESATLFMVLLAGFKVILARNAGTDDIVVGTTNANRTHASFEQMIGMFVNNLALRTSLSGAPTFRDFLGRVRQTALGAYAHQDLPFLTLVDALRIARDPAWTPVFQVLFLLQKLDIALELPGIAARTVEVDDLFTKFDLTLFMEEKPHGIVGTFVYNAELFDESSIDRWAEHLLRTLWHAVEEPDTAVSALRMETDEEMELVTMAEEDARSAKLMSLRTARRRTVSLEQAQLVTQGFLPDASGMPLVLAPAGPGVDLPGWLRSRCEEVDQLLQRHGALLFRGFHGGSVTAFEAAASALCPTLFPEYGDLPREGDSLQIYQSTPYPPDQPILFHNESSHLPSWPMRQFFSCIVAPQDRGETPIVDCRRILPRLRPELAEQFRTRGLRYVRNFIESVDVSWQRFFETHDPRVAERKCTNSGMGWSWSADGILRIWRDADAVLRHPATGDEVFFNQVALHHASCLDPDTRDSLLTLYGPNSLPRNVFWGDGSPIPDEAIAEVRAVMEQESLTFGWQEGDILAIDNMLVAHSRRPFSGPRKIVVALGEMVSAADHAPATTTANHHDRKPVTG